MHKTTILIVGALALMLVAGTGTLWADSAWSGTGSGTETLADGRHIHPFSSWYGTLHTDENPWRFAGFWSDSDGNAGQFYGSTWNGNTCTGNYSGYATVDGDFSITFYFPSDTCFGSWVTTLLGASGSGYIWGHD